MFTGIIDSVGEFVSSKGGKFLFSLPDDYSEQVEIGGSVSVNGVCLTIVSLHYDEQRFSVDISEETKKRTNIGLLRPGKKVNLELPLKIDEFSGRLDGHIVQGHVDTMGKIAKIQKRKDNHMVRLVTSRKYGKFLVDKGSVAVDGISLTPYQVSGGSFTVSVIPHTYNNTTLQFVRGGSKVNLEFDILAKYVNRSVDSS